MKLLKVQDMHCGKCVQRITEAMKTAEVECQVSLEDKTVTLLKDEDLEKAISELEDLGFDAVEE